MKGRINMSIERLGPLDPISTYNKNQKAHKVEPKPARDSISVSNEAKTKAELFKVSEEVRMSPEVREDRIAEIREKLKDPSYINDKVLGDVADKLLDMFGI
jgi:negative regulator of flagellin synthesis FlgM